MLRPYLLLRLQPEHMLSYRLGLLSPGRQAQLLLRVEASQQHHAQVYYWDRSEASRTTNNRRLNMKLHEEDSKDNQSAHHKFKLNHACTIVDRVPNVLVKEE